MYKKLLLFFAVLLPVVGMAQNYDFSVVAPSGQTLYYIVNIGDTSVTLISEFNGPPYYHSTSPAGDLTIPATVTHNQNTYTVTAIGNGAFHGCMDLTSVVIPESVTSIGLSAFYACTTLTALNIPSGVTAIEGSTFASCTSLASVTLPDGITTIGNNAFSECRSLTSVNIPGSVTSIGVTAFQGCSSLTSVTIPEGVTTIGFGVFNLCTSLATVTLPASLTSIGGVAFQNCSTLTSITCLAEAPPSGSMNPFTNVPTGIPVHVPCGSVADYQAAFIWRNFTNIVGINCSTYSVLVYAVPEGYGLVGGTGDYTHGQTATLTATPNTGNHFVHWEEADTVYSRSVDTLATILGDRLFTAVFAPDTYSVAVISADTARGTAAVGIPGSTSSGLGWVEVGYGSTVDLAATPKPGYHFAYWHEDDSVYSHAADTTATVVGDRFILAVFEPDTHDIFVVSNDTAMGDAGVLVVNPGAPAATIEPFAEVEHGTTVSITATPKPGYRFVEWHEDDTLYSNTADTLVTVLADRFLVAIFAQDSHEWVDMGDGVLWATCNVGAVNPWDYGEYYAFGETQPKSEYSWDTYLWGDSVTFTRYTHPNDTLLPEDDAATANWGAEWRMPTLSEWYTLASSNHYSRTYVANYQGSGRRGIVVTRLSGRCRGNSIFLPYAGYKRNTDSHAPTIGAYFSNILSSERSAYGVVLDNSTGNSFIKRINWSRCVGASVRAVRQYPTYTVAAVSDNDTMGNVTGDGFFAHGETDSLTATPNAGYHFVCWMEADTVYSRSADTVVSVTSDRSFTAVFAPDMADLVLTNISYTRVSQNRLRVEYQFVNQGEVDYTETIGFTVYRNHYRGEVLGGGPRMIIDEDMLASSGNVATRSYIFYRAPICSLDPDDSLVIAINDMGFGVGHHAGAQLERDTLNNIAVLHINDVYPYRHAYSVDVQAACDSLTWIDDSTYRASTDTAFITVVQNYNSTPCDSIVRLDLTINHSTTGDTSAVVCDSMQWYGETYTASAEPTQLFEAASAAGCDSTVTLHLTVNYSNASDTTAVACDSLVWYGAMYTSSTSTASHTSVNAAGCDSTVTLHLTVNYSNTGDTTAVACDSLVWYGATYTSSPGSTSLPSHTSTNVAGCDSVVTLNLTVNYSSTGDTTAVECDSLVWYGVTYASSTSSASHTSTNVAGCDSVVTLHLTINYKNTGDTTAVECDQFSWWEHTGLTESVDTLTHFFEAANQWGCDSTVTLHLTVNYQNTGDTTAVECDQFSWWEHTGLTESVDTLTHFFGSGNRWGCDSTVTLHLTVNYQNTGDTTAVECDQFSWWEHTGLTASVDTLTHLLVGGNQWGCDSTVTLHLTVNYQNTGDTTAVECDQFSWWEHTGLTASVDSLTHLLVGGNQWGCDSTVTLHLTVNYQNTGDTVAVECDQFSWYEHTGLTASVDTLTHRFVAANQWGCDSTVTLDLIVNYSNTGDTNAVECDHFLWYGTDYTATGTPTHIFTNIDNCDSIVTLHLTVNYSSTGDTTVVECDQFTWYGTEYTVSTEPTHLFTNQVNCDSTVTLHLTINYQNTGDTTAVECDQFGWYEHTGLTASVDTLRHLFAGGNQWGCDSTVTLHLTINYKNTGDTTAVECDQYSWFEHTGLTASVDTLRHLFAGGNQWGCDSTVTLHLTVNYQNTGDTSAVECDQFSWYEHSDMDVTQNVQHTFVGANRWGCDSTVTLDLTVHYSNTGDTTAVECDQFSWYEHQNLTSSSNNLTHTHVAANQVNCDSTVTLHLTIHYQNTGDTNALTYEPYTWYEHSDMDVTQNVQHTFVGANRWGCDSTVTLHLRYALFATDWSGANTVVYNAQPQTSLGATYVDDTGRIQPVVLTFTKGSDVITTPNYPVDAGVWDVLARPVLPVDSLYGATATLTILPATVYVTGAAAQIAKVFDGNNTAVVTDAGTLNNIQGSDALTHSTVANFSDATIGEDKTITLSYTLHGTDALLNNYVIDPASEVYTTTGAIVDTILPAQPDAFDVAVYGYCVGAGAIGYHLSSGNPDQYKLEYADSRLADVDWTTATGANGTLVVDVPEGLPTGDYTVTVTFREQRFPWIESSPLTVTFHVDLPGSYVKPLFSNVIALIDTCQCFSDIQWYHRSGNNAEWQAIPGANGYYYREESGLTGEYFVNAKMSGMSTYTCPQSDFRNLVSDDVQDAKVIAYPNPSSAKVRIDVSGMDAESHVLRVMNTLGVELENRTFDGVSTVLDMSTWQRGSYIVSVDGMVVRVVRN